MDPCPTTLSENGILEKLKTLFLQKGYPKESLSFNKILSFTLNSLTFEIYLPLVIREKEPLLIVDYHPSKGGLSSFERPLLAIARLFFEPIPFFALLTNLRDYLLIEVYLQRSSKGTEEIIPDYNFLKSYKPSYLKPFKKEVEAKILAFFLSGG